MFSLKSTIERLRRSRWWFVRGVRGIEGLSYGGFRGTLELSNVRISYLVSLSISRVRILLLLVTRAYECARVYNRLRALYTEDKLNSLLIEFAYAGCIH